jgi:hypothetical protein
MTTPYEALKMLGLSPAKAAEIVVDTSRGDAYALHWVDAALAVTPENLSPKSFEQMAREEWAERTGSEP